MSTKRTTIQDIARHAKVSAGTVDRVIHNRGKVSTDKKRRIEDAVKEHNFNPNMLARALSMRNQFTVCALFPQFFSENEYWHLPQQGAWAIKTLFDLFMYKTVPKKTQYVPLDIIVRENLDYYIDFQL